MNGIGLMENRVWVVRSWEIVFVVNAFTSDEGLDACLGRTA